MADENRRVGFQPVDVAGYLVDGGSDLSSLRFTVVWIREVESERKAYAGVPESELMALHDSLKKAGFLPRTLQASPGPAGERTYSGVWEQGTASFDIQWNADTASFADHNLHLLACDVSMVDRGTGCSCAGVWRESPHKESEVIISLDPVAHLARCRELRTLAYQPSSLSLSESVAASVWERPRIPQQAKDKLAQRQANAAVAMLRLGQAGDVWSCSKTPAIPG